MCTIRQWLYLTSVELRARISLMRRKRIRITRRDCELWFIRCCDFAVFAGLARFSVKVIAAAASLLPLRPQLGRTATFFTGQYPRIHADRHLRSSLQSRLSGIRFGRMACYGCRRGHRPHNALAHLERRHSRVQLPRLFFEPVCGRCVFFNQGDDLRLHALSICATAMLTCSMPALYSAAAAANSCAMRVSQAMALGYLHRCAAFFMLRAAPACAVARAA